MGALRRFGRALVRDDRYVPDETAATRLVEKLSRQTCVGPVDVGSAAGTSGRVKAFARFIALHRRHVRRAACDDNDAGWSEPGGAPRKGGLPIAQGVRGLVLEQREALLLVVLAGLTHREAAEALDISLAQLVERLDRARERLARATGAAEDATAPFHHRGPPYLRVIK